MTCLEKYMIDNPHATAEEVIGRICPDATGGMNIEEPEYCDQGGGKNCTRCWNRPVPEAEKPMVSFLPDGTGSVTGKIKDSGTRLEFPTGAVRDIQKGKGRCDLLPLDVIADCYRADFGQEEPVALILDNIQRFLETGLPHHLFNALAVFIGMAFDNCWSNMLLEVSMHFEEGAEKYGEGNWQKGLPVKCYINSAVRHFLKYIREDTDERHDRAFCWNILCAIWTDKHKPELNEYGKKRCPVCGAEIPGGKDNCPYCLTFVGKPFFDPDVFLGEYEEENE